MATVNSGNSLWIVPYEWKLENVDKDFKTIASKMILFDSDELFRVALKKSENGQLTLIFLAINLNKIGLQVSDVVCGKKGVDTHFMMKDSDPHKKKEEKCFKEGHFQLFTSSKFDFVIGQKCTFVFQIHLEEIVADYSYELCDRLGKDQLWSAVHGKLHADVEFIVQDKRFAAHKAILAARSPVFRAEFTQEPRLLSKILQLVCPHHIIRIDVDVDPSSFEQFLHFLYTGEFVDFNYEGEPTPTLANIKLLKLAERYQLKTLENLCRVALLDVNAEQMASLTANLRSSDGQETNCKIWSDIFLFFSLQMEL